ncbi:MAG TPA: TolC family protein, partial [Chitinophagaceae bacterium]|nr:TolC family protein [Chitinophagaceae bacterium]
MKKRGLISTVIILTFAFSSRKAAAQQSQPAIHSFSVQQCVDYAHNNNLQVKNAMIDYALQKQTNRSVTAGALPKVSFNSGLTDYIDIPTTLIPAEFFGGAPGTFAPVKFGTKYNASGSISLSQTIFDGQVFVGLQARQASLDYSAKAMA